MPGIDREDLTIATLGFSHSSGAVVFNSLSENYFFERLRVWSAADFLISSPLFLTWHFELTIFLIKNYSHARSLRLDEFSATTPKGLLPRGIHMPTTLNAVS
jgi:hypothetical protein